MARKKAEEREPIPNNPARDDFDKMQDDGRRFRVVGTTQLGPHPAGKIVSLRDLGPGAEIERLFRKGLLYELTEDEIEDLTAPAEADAEGEKIARDIRLSTGRGTAGPEDIKGSLVKPGDKK